MSYRFMRILVFFDLPMETSADKKWYRTYRKSLIRMGFIMLQKSVYCKLALNQTVVNSVKASLKALAPPNGLVQVLVITEKQYGGMEYVVGEKYSEIIDSDQRVVIL